MFDPGTATLAEFADYVEEHRTKPCPQAVAWLRGHDWTNVDEAPLDFAYFLVLEFLDVLGPIFRAGAVMRIGSDPFWAAHTWLTVPDLTPAEYHYLYSRWAYRFPQYRAKVEEGSVAPGSRAIVPSAAAGRGHL